MKRLYFFIPIIILLLSCKKKDSTPPTQVTYEIATNYFVKNNIATPSSVPIVIDSQARLDSIFGFATVMGDNGKPTKIDFEREVALAFIEDETAFPTEIKINKLQIDNDYLLIDYNVSQGEKQSFTIRPFLMIIINRKYLLEVKATKS